MLCTNQPYPLLHPRPWQGSKPSPLRGCKACPRCPQANQPTDTRYLAVRVLGGAFNGSSGAAVLSARALGPRDAGALDAGSNAAFYLSGNASGTAAQALDARALGAALYDVSLTYDADPGWCA